MILNSYIRLWDLPYDSFVYPALSLCMYCDRLVYDSQSCSIYTAYDQPLTFAVGSDVYTIISVWSVDGRNHTSYARMILCMHNYKF